MQNKDLVSCCLTYGANAKTATLPCLSLLESKCESKVNIKSNVKSNFANTEDALCFSRLLHFTQDLCSYLEFIQREYSLATVSAEPLNKFGLVCYTKFLLLVTCMLLRVRRLNLLNNLAISYLQSVSFMLDHLQPTMSVSLYYLLVFLSTKSFSLRVRTYIGSRVFTNLSHL